MTALPHNNTAIFYVDYSTILTGHTAEVRANGGLSPSAFGTFFDAVMGHLSSSLFPVTINLVRWSAASSSVSNPVTTGIEGNVYGSGAGDANSVPAFLNFIGRSSGGRRVRMAIYGYKNAFSTFRLTPAESSGVGDTITELNALSNGALAIDGLKPTWYSYANVGFSAYWLRAVRA